MNQTKERIVYLNGEFVPESGAKISVFDRCFNWGDGVYDADRTFGGKVCKMWDHVERLYRSLKYMRIDIGIAKDEFYGIVLKVIELNAPLLGPDDDYLVRIQVSRGNITEGGSLHERVPPTPTVAICCLPLAFHSFAKFYKEGVRLVTPATRRTPPQSVNPKAKISGKANHFIAASEARQVHAEAISVMLDLNGYITEATAANCLFVSNGTLWVPNRNGVLNGITMLTVMGLAGQMGISIKEGDYTPFDIYNADEAFLTAASFSILPAASLNGVRFAEDVPGPVTRHLLAAWSELVSVDVVAQAERMAGLRH